MDHLTDAQVLLLAAQYATTPDLLRLRALIASHSNVLETGIVHRLLFTYLPLDSENDTIQQLVALLEDLHDHNVSALDVDTKKGLVLDWTDAEAEDALRSFTLEKVPTYVTAEGEDTLSDFIIAWLHKIEEFGGLSSPAIDLVDQLSPKHVALHQWAETYLRPLSRLQRKDDSGLSQSLSLQDIEAMEGEPGVAALLDFAVHSPDKRRIAEDLEEVVSPWVKGAKSTKRRKLSGDHDHIEAAASWADVNQWLFLRAGSDFEAAAQTAELWNGPSADQTQSDVGAVSNDNVAYIRTILALIFVSYGNDEDEIVQRKQDLLRRATQLAQLMPPEFDSTSPQIPAFEIPSTVTRSDLFDNRLLLHENSLTRPSSDTIDFLHGVLSTQGMLATFKIERATKIVVATTIFDSEDRQKEELRTILNQVPRLTRSNISWSELRTRLHWLRSWSNTTQEERPAYLSRLTNEYLELEILDAILAAGDSQAVKTIYLKADDQILPEEQIQQRVVTAIHNTYDNASNGNRSRGGVKKAADFIAAFRSNFEDKTQFEQLEHLIKATHSLSFYHLTLQHGVPFQPVSIRVSSDPVSLVEKVLQQNEKAYTKLDDLLSIGHNFVLAGLPIPEPADHVPGEPISVDRRLFDVEHRITFAAIEAALADNDFDTAYSLITTRLNTSAHKVHDSPYTDDTSWRAAFAAGKHRPRAMSSPNIHKQISSLQKRMELLSTALMLAPSSELYEILTTWQQLEEELDTLKSQALQEERAQEAQSEQLLPGGFGPSDLDIDASETKRMLESRKSYNATGPSYEEEAPMGLFDVAKGVGSALGRHAFPLRGAQGQGVKVGDAFTRSSMDDARSSQETSRPGSADGQQRTRKRDMISNAVTGGLVSGMSWVLGAPPPRQQGQES